MYDEIFNSSFDPPPSCLDAAYQRKAINEGWTFSKEALFPENVALYEALHGKSCRPECS